MNLTALTNALTTLEKHPPAWSTSPARTAAFAQLARFLHDHIRPGQPYDLKTVRPNPVWMWLEDRLSDALAEWATQSPPAAGIWRINQWYSSGVVAELSGYRLGFDVIPILRAYDWPDRHNLTERIAEHLDALFVTHRHGDHYDIKLVQACLTKGKPVFMPSPLAADWPAQANLYPVHDGQQWEWGGLPFSARIGAHVWRETIEELPVCIYTCTDATQHALVYGGDADYTRLPDLQLTVPVRTYFVPWRAPNARYEAGHEQQTDTLHTALEILRQHVQPATLFYTHCAELEHVHDGFPASFDLALDLKYNLSIPSELLFWGEHMDLHEGLRP